MTPVWRCSHDGPTVGLSGAVKFEMGGTRSDVDVPFKNTPKDLSFGAMLGLDVRKGRFGIGVNGLFAHASPDSDAGDIEIDVTSDSGQLAIAPFYRVLEWQYGTSSSGAPLRLAVAPEAGFRLTYMRTELEMRGGPTADQSETWVDPLIGSRIGLDLTDRWTIGGEANVGGFGVGSDFTGSAQAFFGYETGLFRPRCSSAIAPVSGLLRPRLRMGSWPSPEARSRMKVSR
jgi:hypothetical protein